MVKKLVLVALLVMVPLVVFAEFQLGPSVYYNFPLLGEDTSSSDFSISNFTIGADARLKLWLFQATALGLYTPAESSSDGDIPHIIDLHVTGGVALDLLFLRLGLGLGPSFAFEFGDGSDNAGVGTNVRASAEIKIRTVSLALNYLMKFPFAFSDAGSIIDEDKTRGLFGASLLFRLF
jgi:hypothetical protein